MTFKYSFTLVICFLFFSIVNAQLVPIVFGDASDLGGNCYQVTPDARLQAGAVWYNNPIDLSTDFVIRFRANFGTKDATGADGIGFVLKENPNPEIGGVGDGMGYEGISPSVIVEFDTWRNSFFVDPIAADHIGISTNGLIFNNIAGPIQASATTTNIEDGNFHDVKIQWLALSNTISVTLDCDERLSASSDFVSNVFGGNPIVYFGFTGSTGNSTNEHTICYENISFISLLPNQTICSGNSISIINATTPNAISYNWTPTIGVSNPSIPNPIFTPLTTTIYTVEVTDVCGETYTDSFIANVQPQANSGTDGTISFCDTGSTADLFSALGGTPDMGGVWSPMLASGTGVFDPTNDTPGTYTYTIPGTVPCANVSSEVIVTVNTKPNSGTDGTITLCDTGTSVNLFDSLGGIPDTGGTWTPPLASGSGIFDPNVDTAGTYTYTIMSTNACPDVNSQVTVTINTSPNAGTDGNLNSCATGLPINLFTLLGNNPDIGGTWTPTLASGSGIFDPTIDIPGIYTYTVTGNPPCNNDLSQVIVSLTTSPNAGNDGIIDLCETDTAVDLFDSLGNSPDTGGTWTPPLTSGSGVFDPSIDTAGTYTYTLNIPGCTIANSDVFVTVNTVPNAGTDGNLNSCSTGISTNLFTLLGNNPDTGGTWTPTLASGTGIFDPAIDNSGTYTYTINGTTLCPNDTANVVVTINPAPNAGTDAISTLCSTTVPVDLFDALGGAPDKGGSWTPTLVSGTGIFDPAIDNAGTYTYTINGTTFCSHDTANVVVTINPAPNAGTDATITLCNTAAPVDLFDYLGGPPDTGGVWTPTLASGTGIFDPIVDIAGTYIYTINGSALCPDDTADVVVTVNPAPNAGTDATITLCNTAVPIDLFDYLGGTPDTGGSWTPPLASGTGIFDTAIDAPGTYTYTINGTTLCPDNTADVAVTVNPAPNAGNDTTINLCETDPAIDLFDSLAGFPDTGGTWTPPLTSGTGVFDPVLDNAGTYTYNINGTALCPDDTADVVVTVNSIPNAGEDGSLAICESGMPIDLFTLLGGTPDAGGTWIPALASGTGIFDPTVDTSNVYIYNVTAIAPCLEDTSQVAVNLTTSPDPGLDSIITFCNTDNAISLFNNIPGTPNIGGTWTPALTSGSDIFDPSIDASGTYTYTLSFIGCAPVSSQMVITINNKGNAGEDGAITICKTDNPINLFTLLGNNPDAGGTWTPALASGSGIFDPTIDPSGNFTYTVNGLASCANDTANVLVNTFTDLILLQPGNLKSCDTGSDTTETFNLEQQSAFITADNLDYVVTYHISQPDADTGANPLASPYTNIANPQIIYSRVVNSNTGCFDSSINFNIELEDGVIANTDIYEICDDTVELDADPTNDTNEFDLTSRNTIILGPNQNPNNFHVTYYLTQTDANNASNPLASPFINTINTQTIFARVENTISQCFATNEVVLRVNPLPAFILEESYTICFDKNGVLVNAPTTSIDTGLNTNNYTFEWFIDGTLIPGQTNESIIPMLPGDYSVNITNTATNCSFRDTTVVHESTPPILTAQQASVSFIEDNTIFATAINSSANISTIFEFSLDHGPWLSNTSNDNTYTFENVTPGQHTITAKDINGCGEALTNILIIDFIPYFTPNGDSYNDNWKITGIETQLDAVIYIFDRYGKLLKQLSPNGNGWDGTYNGEILPTNDYWFTLSYRDPNTDERKTFKSHFTLKQ